MRCLVSLFDVRPQSSAKKKKENAEVTVAEHVEVAAAPSVQRGAAAPAAVSSSQGSNAQPREEPASAAGMTLAASASITTVEVARPPEPQSFLPL